MARKAIIDEALDYGAIATPHAYLGPIRTALALAVLAAAGCGGGSRVSEEELRSAVLQRGDLPRVFVQFEHGPIGPIELSGARADPDRFGRVAGWKARYRRPGTLRTRGPLVVESTADAFDSVDGARRDIAAYRRNLSGSQKLSVSVGDESFAVTSRQVSGLTRVRHYTIVWREANASGSLTINGFDRLVRLQDALALARRQNDRLREAASD